MKNLIARKLASFALSVIFAFFLHPVLAQPARYLPGTHYQLLQDNPLLVDAAVSALPTVTEVFWYGCGGCYAFDPVLNDWVAKQENKLRFERSPIVWNRSTKEHARLFYTTRALDVNAALHEDIFDSIHKRGNTLLKQSHQLDYLASKGVATDQALKTMNSFTIDSQLRKAEALQRSIRVPSIPALVINGRYLVNGDNLSSTTEMLAVAEFLLQQQE